MTEAAGKNEQKTDARKKQNSLIRLTVFIALIFFGYLGLTQWKASVARKIQAQREAAKFDNVESEIFDLSGEHEAAKDENLSDVGVNELRERGAEFIYQLLLKNQVQITELTSQVQAITAEMTKYKNQEKIGKMILTYVELRQAIFEGKPHDDALKNFAILATSDENLSSKIERLKVALPDFSTAENIEKTFAGLIPSLITAKENNGDDSLLAKIRRNIAKLVIIRKIDGKNSGEIDATIFKIEQLLKEKNYQEALNSLLSLDQNYHKITADFLNDLSVAIEVQKIDQEILNYLKSLT